MAWPDMLCTRTYFMWMRNSLPYRLYCNCKILSKWIALLIILYIWTFMQQVTPQVWGCSSSLHTHRPRLCWGPTHQWPLISVAWFREAYRCPIPRVKLRPQLVGRQRTAAWYPHPPTTAAATPPAAPTSAVPPGARSTDDASADGAKTHVVNTRHLYTHSLAFLTYT